MFYCNNKKSEITRTHTRTHVHTHRERARKNKRSTNKKKKGHDPSTSHENTGKIEPFWTTRVGTIVEDSSKQHTEGHSSQEEQDSQKRLVCLPTFFLLVLVDKPN